MSIIFDALKKADDKEENTKIEPKAIGSLRKKGNFFWPLFILCICLGLFFLITRLPRKNTVLKPKPEVTPAAKSALIPAAHKKIEAPALPVILPEEHFLEGIIYSSSDPLAIINGKILKKGDKIDDLELVDISQNSVELRDPEDNTSTILSLK